MFQVIQHYCSIFGWFPMRKKIMLLIFCSFCSGVLSIVPIFVLEKIVNLAATGTEAVFREILLLGISYLLLQLLGTGLLGACGYLSEKLQKNIGARLPLKIYDKLCRVDFVQLRNSDTILLTNSILEDTNYIADHYMQPFSQAVRCVISFVFALSYMIHIDILLTALLFPLVLITTATSRAIQHRLSDRIAEKREHNDRLWKLFRELVAGISTIRVFHLQGSYRQQVELRSRRSESSGIAQARLESLNTFLLSALFMGTIGCILIISSIFLIRHRISVGSMVAILMYNHMLVDPLLELIEVQTHINKVSLSISRLKLLLALPDHSPALDLTYSPKTIELDQVRYSYPDQERELHYDLLLRTPFRAAVFGESGIGKSTIAKLLTGLYRPKNGNLNFRDAKGQKRDYPLIAYQEQDGYLFDDSLRNNLSLGDPSLTETAYQKLLEICHLKELAERLGEGSLGENGSKLSGGERKRVLIARTLALSEAEVLIFDEICSSLDSDTAESICQKLLEEFPEKSVLFIDHNPLVKKYVDQVFLCSEKGMALESSFGENF